MNDITCHLRKKKNVKNPFSFNLGCGSLSVGKDFSITETADGVLTCDHTHIKVMLYNIINCL